MSTQPGRIRLEIELSHAPAKVWQFLTVPEKVRAWWAPCDIVPEVGRRFEFDFGKYGKEVCHVLVADPLKKLSYTLGEGTIDTTVTWTLSPEGAGTRLELMQEGFNLDSPVGKMAFDGMSNGWPTVLGRLAPALDAPEST